MIRPTAAHLTRRAARINAVLTARQKQARVAKEIRLREELEHVYATTYRDAVEQTLRSAAERGHQQVNIWIPVSLKEQLGQHLSSLGLDEPQYTTGGTRDVRPGPGAPAGISARQADARIRWGPPPPTQFPVDN